MDKPRIVIAGAGLVGSLLAVLLGRRGHRVTMLEKRPDMRQVAIPAGRSINLALAHRGIDGLELAGIVDRVRPQLIEMRGRMLHDLDGNQQFVPYGQRPQEVIYSVSRAALNKVLMDAAEEFGQAEIRFDCEVTGVDLSAIGGPSLTVVDLGGGVGGGVGGSVTSKLNCDLVIGADGASSAVRRAIVQAAGGTDIYEPLDHAYKELHIPASDAGKWQMEPHALHIWPRGGYMLIALPNFDRSFTVTLFLPSTGEPSFESLDGPSELMDFFRREFPDAITLVPDLERDFFENPTGTLGTIRCWPWSWQRQALVIGDAAHAIVPFHGQGMNAGFEDAAEFARLLDKHAGDFDSVLEELPQRRKPHADAIAQMALENYWIMRDAVRDPQFQFKVDLGFELERRFPDRFIPRYSLVMFHRVGYAEALRRGQIQDEIMQQLAETIPAQVPPDAKSSPHSNHRYKIQRAIDWQLAEQLVTARLEPLVPG